MAYTPLLWVAGTTPLSAANLNNLETQYTEAAADIATHAANFSLHTKVIRKTADETVNNSAVLQNDDDLLFAVGANEIWAVHTLLRFYSYTATSYFKAAFAIPAGATMTGHDINDVAPLAAAGAVIQRDLATATQKTNSTGVHELMIFGVYIGGANAGNIQLQWAQLAAVAENTIVYANSYILAHKLA